MTTDRLYIHAGFVWLIAGMIFGAYLGITGQFHLATVHAHANLLGFVVSVLFGLICRCWPALSVGWIAKAQFGLYQSGTVVLIAAKFSIVTGGGSALAGPGSLLVLLGTVLMLGRFGRATPRADLSGATS